MRPDKISFLGFAIGFALLAAPANANTLACREPETGTADVPVFSPPLSEVVIGTGRLQFYAAPQLRCPISGVFVIPNDQLIAYAETNDGWTSVMYVNPRTGKDVSGWVRSSRLKQTGTMGPTQ